MARAIKSKEATSVEIVRAHIEHIEKLNPRINAVVTLRKEEALKDAQAADDAVKNGALIGPLHGVPLTLKDAYRVKGMRSTFGVPQYSRYKPSADCEVVSRVRNAGAIILGRTNVPFASFDWQCKSPIFGETLNPWNPKHTPGGSSGGAAAALASGFTPIELGSDIAGSIRYPAHCCGVLGLRTTVGLLPYSDSLPDDMPRIFEKLTVCGPMARDYGDLSLMLKVLLGNGAKQQPDKPDPAKLKVAFTASLLTLEPDAEMKAALSAMEKEFSQAGHQVEHREPQIDWAAAYRVWGNIVGYEYRTVLPKLLQAGPGRLLFDAYFLHYRLGNGPLTVHFKEGFLLSEASYKEALSKREAILKEVDRFFEQTDLWILPSSPMEALRIQRRGGPIAHLGQNRTYSEMLGTYLCPTALMGTPALAMPIAMSKNGLPLGVQVHGARFSDEKLVRICEKLFAKTHPVHLAPVDPAISFSPLEK